MRWLALLTAFAVLTAPQVATQTRPADRRRRRSWPPASVPTVAVDAPLSFDEWLATLTDEAREQGLQRRPHRGDARRTQALERVIQSDRSQAELNPGFSRYASAPAHHVMINRGKDLMAEHKTLLDRIETASSAYSARFLVAFWGMESRYGRIQGSTPVFQALATLAWEPRRAAFFRSELFNALTMVQRGHIEPTR